MTALSTIFSRATDLIEPEGKWTRGAFARRADGKAIAPREDTAVCWCVAGAMSRVTSIDDYKEMDTAMLVFTRQFGPIGKWNDAPERTQAEVVATLRALAGAEEQQ